MDNFDSLYKAEEELLKKITELRDKIREEEEKKHERDVQYRLMKSRDMYAVQKILDDEYQRKVIQDYKDRLKEYEASAKAIAKERAELEKKQKEEEKRLERERKERIKQEKKMRDDEFRNLKYYCDIGYMTEDEYYSQLEKLRDKYFEKGSAEWQEYTMEILEYEKKAVSELASEIASHADKSLSEVINLKEKLEKKLSSGNTGLFSESTDTFKINDEVSTVTHTYLNNWEGEIYLMRKYKEGLEGIRKKMSETGFDDEGIKNFFSSLTDLSFHDGIKFTGMLSELSDDEFKKYISEHNEYYNLADELASEFYSSDMETACDEIIKMTKRKFSELGIAIPDEFIETGINGAQKFSEGFLSEIQKFFNQLALDINNFNTQLVTGLTVGGSQNNTNVNSYESNITINSAGMTSQDINNYLAAEEINRQRWMV